MSEVVIIGSVAFDAIDGPGGGGTDILGGSATFAAYAAGFFSPARVVACVGDDFPAEARKILGEKGADLGGLETIPGKTFRWAGKYLSGFRGRETLSLDVGVFAEFKPVLGGPLPKGTFLLLGNIDPDLQLRVLEQAGTDAFVAADTIDHWINSKREALEKGLRRTDLFFLNNEEAELLTGESNMVAAGAKLRAMGPKYVVLKKGEHGAFLFSETGMAQIPAFPLEKVADPTGAGDTFAGAMLGWLSRSGSLDDAAMREAMGRATVMSSFVVEEFSVNRLRRLKPEEIDARLAELRQQVKF